MGLFALASRIIVAVFGLLVPSFRTWQARARLNSNQSDQQTLHQVEIYSEYWVIAGILFGTEMLAGWLIDWVPFYYELRALFVLWLIAPATQGSTLLYNQYVVPFMLMNEKRIDSSITAASSNLFTFATNALRSILQFVLGRLSAAQQAASQQVQANGAAQQPAANSAGSFTSLFAQYAPAMLTAGATLLNPAAKPASPASAQQATAPPAGGPPDSVGSSPPAVPKPFSPGPAASSMSSQTPDLRQRNASPNAQPYHLDPESNPPPFPVPQPSTAY